MASPHEILGLKPTATAQEIRSAYLRLAQQHHPDAGGDQTEFVRVVAAYEHLTGKAQSRFGWKDPHPKQDPEMERYGIPPSMQAQWDSFKDSMRRAANAQQKRDAMKPKPPKRERKPRSSGRKPANFGNHHPPFAERGRPVAWNVSAKGNLWFLCPTGPVTVFKDKNGRWSWVQTFAKRGHEKPSKYHGPFNSQQVAQADAEANWEPLEGETAPV